ncbi:MAG: hypothetical protein K0S25_143 [Bacillus sp. (in: firmicutes)]|jgi:hypothetical protein|nr:hypothetical protein [Bacillus sp. (in: firmicutes)]
MNELVITKKDLKTIGFSDYQASQIIRIVKVRLKNRGVILYSNKRIGFAPFDAISRYLLGVLLPLEKASSSELKKQFISLPELTQHLRSEHIAKQVIRDAQQAMVDKGCDFYLNVRHFMAPRDEVNAMIYGKEEATTDSNKKEDEAIG